MNPAIYINPFNESEKMYQIVFPFSNNSAEIYYINADNEEDMLNNFFDYLWENKRKVFLEDKTHKNNPDLGDIQEFSKDELDDLLFDSNSGLYVNYALLYDNVHEMGPLKMPYRIIRKNQSDDQVLIKGVDTIFEIGNSIDESCGTNEFHLDSGKKCLVSEKYFHKDNVVTYDQIEFLNVDDDTRMRVSEMFNQYLNTDNKNELDPELYLDIEKIQEIQKIGESMSNYSGLTNDKEAEILREIIEEEIDSYNYDNLLNCGNVYSKLKESFNNEILERFIENSENKYMDYEQVKENFEMNILPYVQNQHPDDYHAETEAWNNYTDSLHKEGKISSFAYSNWTYPENYRENDKVDDISEMTSEDEKAILIEILDEEEGDILSVSGIYEELVEEYNNLILEKYEDEQKDIKPS